MALLRPECQGVSAPGLSKCPGKWRWKKTATPTQPSAAEVRRAELRKQGRRGDLVQGIPGGGLPLAQVRSFDLEPLPFAQSCLCDRL